MKKRKTSRGAMVVARSPQDHQGADQVLAQLSDLVPMMEVVYRSVHPKLRPRKSNEFKLLTMIQRDELVLSMLVREKMTGRVGHSAT